MIPVKGSTGKSRLAHPDRAELASAIALDTIEAVCGARHVAEVVVVTSDGQLAVRTVSEVGGGRRPEVRVVPDPGAGLNPAITAGLTAARPDRPRAALLGDLPALTAADLDAALDLAAAHERAFVPDAEGTGTTLITASAGAPIEPAFGAASAARHAASGFASLPIPAASTLRRDVDTADQLSVAAHLGLGPRTSALL
ncbi:2-phospho-L-lactate guanylyltransferase [Microbacterium rhizophilus]|uniref:2-phospho-L-lactate guanylyltransferase n=1 Tax=Microbacterium rhizophilus TaxID=3138934 RepID=UPI0031E769E2